MGNLKQGKKAKNKTTRPDEGKVNDELIRILF